MTTALLPTPTDVVQDDTEPTHIVCECQVDATPRLALCGADCTHEAEGMTATPCVVCLDLVTGFVAAGGHCDRCAPRA